MNEEEYYREEYYENEMFEEAKLKMYEKKYAELDMKANAERDLQQN